MKVVEGHAPFVVGDETFETYYKVVGDLENRTKTPLVLLHGGPSFAHNYLLSCVDLNASFNIPLVFYDQLGSGGKNGLQIVQHVQESHLELIRFRRQALT
jgi:pimeloyl-ACP methyl ester carboxylesterase